MDSSSPPSDVQVITESGCVTIRLPDRVLSDPSEVVSRMNRSHYWDSTMFLVISLALLTVTVVIPLRSQVGTIQVLLSIFLALLPPIVLVAVIVVYCRRRHVTAVKQQRSGCELQLRSDELRIWERTPYRDSWFFRFFWPTRKSINPLSIGRLQIQPVDLNRADNVNETFEPHLWPFLNGVGHSLIADNHDGRTLTVLAHGYPKDVLLEAAVQLKQQLDAYRIRYDQQLLAARPGIQLPEYDGIPIYYGPRLREPKEKPQRPTDAIATLDHQQGDVVITVPRGEQMEAIEFRANPGRLTISRELLLGNIQHKIKSEHLRKIKVNFKDMVDSDQVLLTIKFFDTKTRQKTTLELLEGLSMWEICWIAGELREACPPTGDQADPVAQGRFQFSIAHLLFATTLICVFMGCSTTIKPWGWVFGIQAVTAILCVTSFTGIRQLAPLTNRSWTKGEIAAAVVLAVVLSIVWLIRFASTFQTQ